MDRALPSRMIDKIRDGVSPNDLAKKGDRAVFNALVSTAASAQMRGWNLWDWEPLILEPKSHLGTQLRLKGGRRARTPMAIHKTLGEAWEKAWEWCTEKAPWNAAEVRQVAQERGRAAKDVAADPDADLTDAERSVLSFAAAQSLDRGLLQVALPVRILIAATGLGLTALRTALKRLETKGLLTLVEAGKPRGPKAKMARANLYALPGAPLCAGEPGLWCPSHSPALKPVVPQSRSATVPQLNPVVPLCQPNLGTPPEEPTPLWKRRNHSHPLSRRPRGSGTRFAVRGHRRGTPGWNRSIG
jgi:hypothetical protein